MSLHRRRAFHRQRMGHRDANHLTIREGLRKLGFWVADFAGAGDGCPDLLVRHPSLWGENYTWLEIKVGTGKLRASQLAWRASAEARGVRVATVRSLDEAVAVVTRSSNEVA